MTQNHGDITAKMHRIMWFMSITLINATIPQKSWESILFQPVLKAYPTHHSWIITAHVSSGNLEKQWRMFIKQMGRTQQLLNSLQQKPLAPTYMISALQAEFTNLDSIYPSYKQQIVLHICSILANLRDSLYYMRQVAMHAMDYIDAATTGILSPHVLTVEDLWKMLIHIKEALPSSMHLPHSSEDTLHL